MKRKKLSRSFVLLCLVTMILTSCVNNNADTTVSDSEPAGLESVYMTEEETENITDTQEGEVTEDPDLEKTPKPKLEKRKNMSEKEAMIYGTVTPDSIIRIRYPDGTVEETKAAGKYFYVRVRVEDPNDGVYISAKAEGYGISDETLIYARLGDKDNGVIAGTSSRLYYNATVPFHQGLVRAESSMINYVKTELQNRVKKVRELTGKDTKFVYLICPNPMTIYSDELFKPYSTKQNKTPTTHFVDAMKDVDGIIAPDLRDILNSHKTEDIFFRTDTHWSELGAYYAYEAMMTEVKKDHPDATVRTLEDFELVREDCTAGDLASMMGVNQGMYETVTFVDAKFDSTGDYYKIKRSQDRRINVDVSEFPLRQVNSEISGPKAYFMGDSYGAFLLPYLGMSFSQVDMNEGALWNYTMDYAKIASEKPDYIIFCYTERNIGADMYTILAQ